MAADQLSERYPRHVSAPDVASGPYLRRLPIVSPGLRADVVGWWERYAQREVSGDKFAQIDLDELIDDPPALAVAEALEAVQIALELARANEPAIIGLVTIPLEPSESLVTESPDLEQLLTTPWTYGPGRPVPGVYLLPSDLLEEVVDDEFRLDITHTGQLPPGFIAYYRCWRGPDEASRGWEYHRTIYVRSARAE
jgi:hypothetical protein